MNRAPCETRQRTGSDLERIIHPLASYICAADRPRAVLQSAVAVLLREVQHVNDTARRHVSAYSRNHQS